MVFQCFQALKLYGREPEQLEAVNGMFQLVLAEYHLSDIRRAFAYYLSVSSEMPTPADICNIIRRGNKPPLERSVYVSISKKPPCERDTYEWSYMREYEAFLIHG